MNILELHREKKLADFYNAFVEAIKQTAPEKNTKAQIAKLQTGWMRYVLPGWGFPLKLEGNFTPQEVADALQFMQQISLFQADQALDIQEQVFQQFGDRISPEVQRVYRSVVRKSLEWGRQQNFWEISLGSVAKDCAPAMGLPRGTLKPGYSLKKSQYTDTLQQEIDHLCQCWRSVRVINLKEDSIHSYLKDINCLLGWLHYAKAVPIEDLSLVKIIPPKALHDPRAAKEVAELATEYLEWLRVEREHKPSTRLGRLYAFIHITEYIHYVHGSISDLQQPPASPYNSNT